MEVAETIETPQQALIAEIHYQYWVLTNLAAEIEAQKFAAGSIERLRDFREPLIRLMTLASFNPRFAESIKSFYPAYRRKMLRWQGGDVFKFTDYTLWVWQKISRALRDSKIIILNGE